MYKQLAFHPLYLIIRKDFTKLITVVGVLLEIKKYFACLTLKGKSPLCTHAPFVSAVQTC